MNKKRGVNMKTLSQVFNDIRNGKQKEVNYPALICAMAEGVCSDCQFGKENKTPIFGCCDWLAKKLLSTNRRRNELKPTTRIDIKGG